MAFAFDPSAYISVLKNFLILNFKKQNILGMSISQQTTTVNTTAFNILSYEISAPVVFVTGKFNAALTPAYVMPQHLLTGERGKEMFYITASIGVRL